MFWVFCFFNVKGGWLFVKVLEFVGYFSGGIEYLYLIEVLFFFKGELFLGGLFCVRYCLGLMGYMIGV